MMASAIFDDFLKTHTLTHDLLWALPMCLVGMIYGWLIRRFIFPRNIYPFYDYARFGFTIFTVLTLFLILRAWASDGRVDWYVNVVIYYWVTCFSLGGIAGYWSVAKDHKPHPIHAGIEHLEDGIVIVDPEATTRIHNKQIEEAKAQQKDHPKAVVIIEDNKKEPPSV